MLPPPEVLVVLTEVEKEGKKDENELATNLKFPYFPITSNLIPKNGNPENTNITDAKPHISLPVTDINVVISGKTKPIEKRKTKSFRNKKKIFSKKPKIARPRPTKITNTARNVQIH